MTAPGRNPPPPVFVTGDPNPGDATPPAGPLAPPPTNTPGQWMWRLVCRGIVWVFYRRIEVQSAEKFPDRGPVLLCANHLNALVDVVILQAACRRPLHPLARSGLFANPVLRPVLRLIQAVPVYRRHDSRSDPNRNTDAFARCFELLLRGEVVLIFPEGQSHSDPHLRPFKTGAARIALGARCRAGDGPHVLPIGLSFTHKGKFRSGVLVEIGDPLALPPAETALPPEPTEPAVRQLTAAIEAALTKITLNLDSWEDLDLLWRLERFFAFRRGRHLRSLRHRFRALKRLVEAHRLLRAHAPQEVRSVRRKLRHFERLRTSCGVKDYHLEIRYTPSVVARYLGRFLLFLVLVLPLGAWGIATSCVPLLLTRHLSEKLAKGVDQYDSAKVVYGFFLFLLFWGGQIGLVFFYFGTLAATLYGVTLPLTAAFALTLLRQKGPLLENLRVFFLFTKRKELRRHLLEKRQEVERELARLARLIARLPGDTLDADRGGTPLTPVTPVTPLTPVTPDDRGFVPSS